MKIIGKKYREAECKICGYKWETSEATINGLSKKEAKIMTDSGFPCKKGDDVCMGCFLESLEFIEDNLKGTIK